MIQLKKSIWLMVGALFGLLYPIVSLAADPRVGLYQGTESVTPDKLLELMWKAGEDTSPVYPKIALHFKMGE